MRKALQHLLYSATSIQIGIGPEGLAALEVTKGRRKNNTELLGCHQWIHDHWEHIEISADSFRDILGEKQFRNRPVTIILSDQWTRQFMTRPPLNATSLRDCQVATLVRFQELYGGSVDDWQLMGDWDITRKFFTCAVPKKLLTTLNGVAKELGFVVLSIVPQFIAAWNGWYRMLDQSAWFGLAHNETLSLAAIEKGHLCALHAVPLLSKQIQKAESLSKFLARESVRLNCLPPTKLQLCGHSAHIQEAFLKEPQFCQRLSRENDMTDLYSLNPAILLARTGVV